MLLLLGDCGPTAQPMGGRPAPQQPSMMLECGGMPARNRTAGGRNCERLTPRLGQSEAISQFAAAAAAAAVRLCPESLAVA